MEICLKIFIAIHSISLALSGIVHNRQKVLSARIVGDQGFGDIKHPYQVSIRRYNNSTFSSTEHICAGAILNKRWIVSSAYCVTKAFPDPNDLLIGIGERTFTRDSRMLRTEEIIVHPDYKSENKYDISLIKTSDDIEFNDDIQPISLSKEPIGDKNEVTVCGWATTNNLDTPDVALFINMKTITNEECALLYGPNQWDDFIDKSILCAIPYGERDANQYSGLCHGDAGSPLVKDSLLIGIAIWNHPEDTQCGKGTPDQFTRISEYLTWIKKHVNVSIQ